MNPSEEAKWLDAMNELVAKRERLARDDERLTGAAIFINGACPGNCDIDGWIELLASAIRSSGYTLVPDSNTFPPSGPGLTPEEADHLDRYIKSGDASAIDKLVTKPYNGTLVTAALAKLRALASEGSE